MPIVSLYNKRPREIPFVLLLPNYCIILAPWGFKTEA